MGIFINSTASFELIPLFGKKEIFKFSIHSSFGSQLSRKWWSVVSEQYVQTPITEPPCWHLWSNILHHPSFLRNIFNSSLLWTREIFSKRCSAIITSWFYFLGWKYFYTTTFASEKIFYEWLRDHTARSLLYTIKIFFNLDNVHCEFYY